MKAWKKILGALDRVAQGGLSLQELTIALPLLTDDAAKRLPIVRERLAALAAMQPSPYARVPGVHSARWMLLHSAGDPSVPGPLLCSLVFEGNVDDVLFATIEQLAAPFDSLLEHCQGAPRLTDAAACVAYLKRHRIEAGYFFSDHRTRTRTEITEAIQVKGTFKRFYAATQMENAEQLRHDFAKFRAELWDHSGLELGHATPLSRPFERRREQEEAWTRRSVELARRLQERGVRSARQSLPSARPLRVAHAKHHGCVRARFIVNSDLPFAYQHGIFVPGKEFEALLRFSNTSHTPRPDYAPDARGVALKILNVGACGEPLVPGIPDGVQNAGTTQDFLMLSSPNFFAKDIRDFTIFRSILDVGTPLQRAPRLAAFFLTRPRELGVLGRAMLRPVSHPLKVVYHSVTPSLLGPHQVVKHSLRLKTGQDLVMGKRDWSDQNFLKTALQQSLHPRSGRAVELEFSIHVPGDAPLSVEDSSLNWERHGVTRVPVATVVIEPQDFTTPAALEACEACVFSPWHSLEAHKPLGSLNRARLAIYRASSAGRGATAADADAPASQERVIASAAPSAEDAASGDARGAASSAE